MPQALKVHILLLDLPEGLLPLLLVHTRVPDAVEGDFNEHAFCLDDDIVLKFGLFGVDVTVIAFEVEILVAPKLPRLCQEVGTSELFYTSLQDHDQLVYDRPFLEHDLVSLVIPGPHVLKKLFLVHLDQPK